LLLCPLTNTCDRKQEPGEHRIDGYNEHISLRQRILDMNNRGRKEKNTNDNLKKLTNLASQDKVLSAKLQKAGKEQVVALVKEHGIKLTETDSEASQGKVSDDELAVVAGGTMCFCMMGSDGKASESKRACACVIAGIGKFTDGSWRCDRPMYGSGDDICGGL
jgi:predicted ribosomally synthesized peptide with nif11-like leader